MAAGITPAADLSGVSWAACAAATAGRVGSRRRRSYRWRRGCSAQSCPICRDPTVTSHTTPQSTSLKIKGLLGGVGWWRTISASILREFGNIRGLQHPWRASTDLLGLQSAERNHAVHSHRRNVQTLRGLQQGDFSAFRQFAFSEDFDFMVIAERAEARFAPRRHSPRTG
jgi:hypothetical protein